MQLSFILLTVANTLLLVLTVCTGLGVEGRDGFSRHFLLGILAAFFTCFVHIVAFVYFIVQDKIVKQSILLNGLDAAYAGEVDRHKFRVLVASLAGISCTLVVAILGASGGVTRVGSWHAIGGYILPALNLVFAIRQYREIGSYRLMFRRAFGES
jgi:hypothetical protein